MKLSVPKIRLLVAAGIYLTDNEISFCVLSRDRSPHDRSMPVMPQTGQVAGHVDSGELALSPPDF